MITSGQHKLSLHSAYVMISALLLKLIVKDEALPFLPTGSGRCGHSPASCLLLPQAYLAHVGCLVPHALQPLRTSTQLFAPTMDAGAGAGSKRRSEPGPACRPERGSVPGRAHAEDHAAAARGLRCMLGPRTLRYFFAAGKEKERTGSTLTQAREDAARLVERCSCASPCSHAIGSDWWTTARW